MQIAYEQTELPILMEFAYQYENEANQAFQCLKNLRIDAKRQKKDRRKQILQPLESALQSLQEAISIYDTCQNQAKAIFLCIKYLQICALYRQSIDQSAFSRKQQRFSFIIKTIKKIIIPTPLSSQEEIGSYLTLLKLYRGLRRYNDYKQLVQNMENVMSQNSYARYKQLTFRQTLFTLYEDWISTIQQQQSLQQSDKQKQKRQVWIQLLKYELEQPNPNYRSLYRVSNKYFDFIYQQFAFLLLMDDCDAASELLNYAIANQFDFEWLQLSVLRWLIQRKKEGVKAKCKFIMEYKSRYYQADNDMKFKIYEKLVNFKRMI